MPGDTFLKSVPESAQAALTSTTQLASRLAPIDMRLEVGAVGELITLDEMRRINAAVATELREGPPAIVIGRQQFVLAREIVRRAARIEPGAPPPKAAGAYLEPDDTVARGGLRVAERVIELADLLYLLRDVPGFEGVRKKLETKPWEDIVAELRLAGALKRSGWPILLVEESRSKGDDYDLAVEIDGRAVAVEASRVRATTPYRRQTLVNVLKHAKKQLPKAGPGIVVLDLPDHWFVDSQLNAELGAVVDDFFRNTRRVNAALLFGKVYEYGERSMRVFHWIWRDLHPNPKVRVANLAGLVKRVDAPPQPAGDSRVHASFWEAAQALDSP